MTVQTIVSPDLADTLGHFSHASAVEVPATARLVFISGMTARNAEGGITGIGDITAQTHQVCQNLKAAVEAAGGTLADIARVDVYVRDMADFEAIHAVRRQYFTEHAPASTMVEISRFVRLDYLIEINAIAAIGTSS
ncbi:RidA family protein [Kribbella sandramycini]|uniref:Enamine deaminase RidA (YjgF/YER057c/UK114 family) n=1 Tax=Kribbella sandramycini TaxID=60450 RepID=A0A7Y4KVT2_9ACTN|nr:RidA family protein [Kribbella sandramycini]MBB6567760.1 enamine deaminase RidA (YjgF/YER057c/UK114 family) [Kribbella sandramycini]NOL39644.1 RidA family protein [Kribbella sandramycini]